MSKDPFDFAEELKSQDCQFYTLSSEQCAKNLEKTRDLVFFTGAGFSKAWNSAYPLGFELFSIKNIDTVDNCYNFIRLADELHITRPVESDSNFSEQCYEYFSEIKFHLDIFKRYPSLMPKVLDTTTISMFENEISSFILQRFKEMVGANELNLDCTSKLNHNLVRIFKALSSSSSNLTFLSTNYDYIIEKIFTQIGIKNLNRGIVDREQFNKKSWGTSEVNLFKLNGGFEVYNDASGFHLDYGRLESPDIILPSKDQSYDSSYYKNMFTKSASNLRDASKLIFVGYSLPEEDHTIRLLLKSFIDYKGRDKEIYVINRDLESSLKICEKVAKLFPVLAENNSIFAIDGSLEQLSEHV
ncbi:SIR2 family protein [Photobacterium leiognathi]|uniref:SIR2 family protein n=1 Tax=Photobacterium leiognathi TaxID=553611 RepID=UPI003DA09FC9